MTEESKATAAKIGVFKHWTMTLRDIQWEIEEYEYDLEYQRYEIDVTQRLHDATADDKARKHWQKQSAKINKALVTTETDLAKARQQAAYSEAMLALLRQDLSAAGIDPDACNPDDFYCDEAFDAEFDADEIPF
ncbi:MAG TPA: hypothetical protein PLH19_06980 [Anaerolineae bacterium]|nr:hypothetical protein [Anaerolineae bacterium]HQH38265.1 hypothetical protein [Anaerolineae bacterium]